MGRERSERVPPVVERECVREHCRQVDAPVARPALPHVNTPKLPDTPALPKLPKLPKPDLPAMPPEVIRQECPFQVRFCALAGASMDMKQAAVSAAAAQRKNRQAKRERDRMRPPDG